MLQDNGYSRYARLADLKSDALSLDRERLISVLLELVMVPEETFVGADRIQVAHDAVGRERRQMENQKPTGSIQANPYGQKFHAKQEGTLHLDGPIRVKREEEAARRANTAS
eukprot:CAMPEP_0118954450 /NCGR_PEP_ID=MMETSP1169-20130426/58241_1 /TAXON_ID=36882 /ORGANISM="Pyramimonas obovata, Strain CCMP722" /LENGTH=111 /DNA_ID=CAMNT_0006902077 /DNA_START=217 /DNA_END=549 /DNA_ORIENTATION=+